ncbi:hypothetical protein [uncultured Phascolarctobacterium sp.]|uniref:hypothetical protein n=1 Tax=uncultured Phascolarctobacterium sp. TaxID=512296 RepID=UPI00260D0F89|nr:hypothetical protein [uncultured Phascolarctobacterium sp.]
MKKLILCVLFLLICSVCAAAPAKKVVLWYQVPDAILEVQNPENDMEKGKAELEAFIKTNYGKRFDIQIVKRAPEKNLTAADVSLVTRPNWVPVIVKIDLAGVGTGEKLVGKYATVKVALQESAVVDGTIYTYDYGVKEYDSSMLRVAGYVVASEDDPRINTKNAVNDCITEACTLNDKVNRYADPAAYEKENARYNGEFQNIK